MIKTWSISNFKAITTTRVINENKNKSNEILLKPLTVFCGANNGGKSSFLQSVLLIVQTLRHPNKTYPLILNDEYVNLGKFDDLINDNSNNDNIEIKFNYEPINPFYFPYFAYPFNDYNKNTKDEVFNNNISFKINFSRGLNVLPDLSKIELTLNFIAENNIHGNSKKYFTLFFYSDKPLEYIKNIFFETNNGFNDDLDVETIPINKKYQLEHFIPKNITVNGSNIIMLLALRHLFNFLNINPIQVDIPDQMFLFNENDSKCYYSENMTSGLFDYLKNEILFEINEIENIFDLGDFRFIHKSQGYPFYLWFEKINKLDINLQEKIRIKLEENILNIANKMINEFTLLKEFVTKDEEFKHLLMEKNDIDFSKKENEYFSQDIFNASRCAEYFNQDLTLSFRINEIMEQMSLYFQMGINYIGPLREEPKLLYPFADSSYKLTIGKKGENTAAILALNSKNTSMFPVPELNNKGTYKAKNITLKKAVILWLKYIGIAENFNAKTTQGGFIFRVKTFDSKHYSDLTNVGVGVSQILPIVVMCLSAMIESITIIEQPELHLHPKIQSKLTDFFIAISQFGKQCIIETHSEHIINALRYRIAKTTSPEDEKLAKNIQIYFVNKDEKGSVFRSITIDKYAYISEWPDGFFDEAQLNSLNTLDAINEKLEKDPPNE